MMTKPLAVEVALELPGTEVVAKGFFHPGSVMTEPFFEVEKVFHKGSDITEFVENSFLRHAGEVLPALEVIEILASRFCEDKFCL
jgi:hypothetical protein